MATLTQTAYFARQAIKFGGIAFGVLILLRAGFITIRKMIPAKPAPLPPPNVAFGKLPRIKFPEKSNLPQINYRLETISGVLPKMPTQGKVYFMPHPSVSFMDEEKINSWAKALGFIQKPEKAGPGEFDYRFTIQPPMTIVNINSLTRNFSFTYDWRNDTNFSLQTPPEDSQAIAKTTAFLQTAQSLPDDIDKTSGKVIYLKNDNNNLIESIYQEANFSKVNLFRLTDDGLKILPSDPNNSNIYVIVSSGNNKFNGVTEARYIHNLISTEINATYPLKDINQAWTQLVENKGFIASLGNNQDGNVTIRDAYLAYYEVETNQSYLQPIIVFTGDKGFTAYVPAIADNLFAD